MIATAVYGPPGTGKTTWMMDKVAELIREGYAPNEIMYLSFTKAAATEVLRRMGVRSSNAVSTIHSACYRLLNLGGASVVNYRKLLAFGHIIGMKFSGGSDDALEVMEVGDQFLSLYSLARNRLSTNEDEYERSDRPGSWSEFQYFFESYDSWKEANGLIDFTDMLEKYQTDPRSHGCRVIFVDESQDLSPLQWEVVREMADMDGVEKVFIAGDDDQAIYEWAGADPHGMATFEADYSARRLVLDRSYRVPSEVHRVVTGISANISHRVDKFYHPRDEKGVVEYDEIFEPSTQSEGFILCRSHSIKQKVERELILRRMPFMSEGGGLPGPFSCKAAKAIRAWKRYKDTGVLNATDLDAMSAAAIDRVRGDLLAGDRTSVLDEDPFKVFKIPYGFVDYFRDVDIYTQPKLNVMTIHNSKGREAQEVTVVTDWPPRVQAGFVLNPDQEHRVWYVAASRAKNILRVASLGESGYNLW